MMHISSRLCAPISSSALTPKSSLREDPRAATEGAVSSWPGLNDGSPPQPWASSTITFRRKTQTASASECEHRLRAGYQEIKDSAAWCSCTFPRINTEQRQQVH